LFALIATKLLFELVKRTDNGKGDDEHNNGNDKNHG
jgi:hypothetical protein